MWQHLLPLNTRSVRGQGWTLDFTQCTSFMALPQALSAEGLTLLFSTVYLPSLNDYFSVKIHNIWGLSITAPLRLNVGLVNKAMMTCRGGVKKGQGCGELKVLMSD